MASQALVVSLIISVLRSTTHYDPVSESPFDGTVGYESSPSTGTGLEGSFHILV